MRLALPLSLDGSSFATVRVGSDAELQQNVRVILGTFVGERLVVPDFGIEDPTFGLAPSLDEGEIVSTVQRWQEDARVEVSYGESGMAQDITVGVTR